MQRFTTKQWKSDEYYAHTICVHNIYGNDDNIYIHIDITIYRMIALTCIFNVIIFTDSKSVYLYKTLLHVNNPFTIQFDLKMIFMQSRLMNEAI